jgi:hypothetical protein
MTIQIFADDEWEGFESDNEAEHSVWKGIGSETDTPKDSNSHGNGVLPRLRVFSEMKDGTSAELNDNLDPDHHLSILSNLIRRTEKPPGFVNGSRYQYAQIIKNLGAKAIEEQILGSLEKDLRHLIGTRRSISKQSNRATNQKRSHVFDLASIFM